MYILELYRRLSNPSPGAPLPFFKPGTVQIFLEIPPQIWRGGTMDAGASVCVCSLKREVCIHTMASSLLNCHLKFTTVYTPPPGSQEERGGVHVRLSSAPSTIGPNGFQLYCKIKTNLRRIPKQNLIYVCVYVLAYGWSALHWLVIQLAPLTH